MKFSLCCGAKVFNVGGWKGQKFKCSRCFKLCTPVLRGNWKDVYQGK